MPEATTFPLLTALIVVPTLGAAGAAITPRRRPELAKVIGVTAAVAEVALAGWLLYKFDVHSGRQFQFTSAHAWIKSFGISRRGRSARSACRLSPV